MMVIGIDPHKSTHTATAVDPHTNRAIASLRIDASLAEYRRLMRWARQFEQRRWAVENAEGLGRHLSTWLLARGEQVVDVPTTATARVRSSRAAAGARTIRSTLPLRPAWPRCKARAVPSSPRASPTLWRCWMSLG